MKDKTIIIGSKLLSAGYIYHRSRRGNNTIQYWDCTKSRQKECMARAITSGEDENVIMVKESEQADVEVFLLELAQGRAIRDAPKKK